MATANRDIKARLKATPDRIQQDICNSKVIKSGLVLDNNVRHIAETSDLCVADLPQGNLSVPLNLWLENAAAIKARSGLLAVQLASDEALTDLAEDLGDINMIVLPFVNFVDGRGYSHARRLRQEHNYKGEIRAVGDVHFDQLHFLARVGCDAFELPDGDDHQAALRAFTEFSEVYQPASDAASLIFSRRRAVH
ncbi:MAG: DUF934 domain-containing protein [Gammaproteobacteria bacterium]|nr:DUF934 domain-containing protein [Gammaproteobacteria bacterium]